MISPGISQVGGKFRLRKELLARTPYHEFFLSLFAGSCVYEINKARCRYECFNDLNAEIINYFLQVREHPKEFDDMKKGVFGLVSQEICNRIVNGELIPNNDLERAYFFYYLNKLSFGGDSLNYSYRGITLPSCSSKYRGISPSGLGKKAEEAKAHYGGLQVAGHQVRKTNVKDAKASYRGISMKASYKGINPKTTRPYTNNDCGLLTPLDPETIKRLRYVNLTCYDFAKVYDMFYQAFHVRKELNKECFVYADPPYVGTEKYYNTGFGETEHAQLVERMLETPFHFMLSIGGECEEIYVDPLKEAGWTIDEVFTRYSTDANSQDKVKEYIIYNYNINEVPMMREAMTKTIEEWFK